MRCSYLGRDQGRETAAGDVAHLVWTERSQNLVTIERLGVGYRVEVNGMAYDDSQRK